MSPKIDWRSWVFDFGVAASLIAIGFALRLACVDIPNFSPVAGLALLAGVVIQRRVFAIAVPMGTMLLSDRFLTGYSLPVMISVYGCFLLPVVLGRLGRDWIAPRRNGSLVRAWGLGLGSGLASSIMFFLVTNATYWASFELGRKSLTQCYVDGLPFFKYTLAGDLVFGAVAMTAFIAATAFNPFSTPIADRCESH